MKQIELCLLAEAAERELNTAVQQIAQKYNLPCWVMEPIVYKLHKALLDGRAAEVAAARMTASQQETSVVEQEANENG